ncbi:HNH endonuclease [Devosia sp. LjRoot16]|uniref:HNH endonuclease n=1 Tax=Devosia sp. LjRoot16 TaxID=3342271 RepID=UPI003ECC63A0
MATRDEVQQFYVDNYDFLGQWIVRPGDKLELGEKSDRVCRFCGKKEPEVTFRKVAHAIPESLGNKSITSYYECDPCNELFGMGIENDLGNWSKPMRTMARIRGKSGVPTLKKGGDGPGWRIEFVDGGFEIKSYEDDPVFEMDEANSRVTFKLKRDPYTPVAVLKAFMKIGLTLMPAGEMRNFEHLLAWIRDADHSRPFADKCPIMYTFSPGPRPNDSIGAMILRRKPAIVDQPYAYLILTYGNEQFQVQLPSEEHDGTNAQYSIHPFPPPRSADPQFDRAGRALLDLTSREVVRGEVFPVTMGFTRLEKKEAVGGTPGDAPETP